MADVDGPAALTSEVSSEFWSAEQSNVYLGFEVPTQQGYILLRMIIGSHFLLYSRDAEADRKFFRDVLRFPCVDAGEGWLIFGMSPAEAGIHPMEGEFSQQHAGHQLLGAVLYLMCDDLKAEIASLMAQKVQCTEIEKAPWVTVTTIPLPSGGSIGLYQPSHQTALNLHSKSKPRPKSRLRSKSKPRSKK